MAKIISCSFIPHTLFFYRPAGTSRGVLYEKLSYFLRAENGDGKVFYGECGLLKGLSIDDKPNYEKILARACQAVTDENTSELDLLEWPSIRCGLEILEKEISNNKRGFIFNNPFYSESNKIPINGLIWMGDKEFMIQQINTKVDAGFRCIKMKVGALDWETEKIILQTLRDAGGDDLTIRVDANGAWDWSAQSQNKMEFLHRINVHSIEQPVAVDQQEDMFKLSEWSPVDIALDEELFNYHTAEQKAKLLDRYPIKYIVLKPSLVGGFQSCDEWISLCKQRGINYWMTSALESNVALNAIAQYTYPHANNFYQGLGTGSLYENNIDSPLEINRDAIFYNKEKSWNFKFLES